MLPSGSHGRRTLVAAAPVNLEEKSCHFLDGSLARLLSICRSSFWMSLVRQHTDFLISVRCCVGSEETQGQFDSDIYSVGIPYPHDMEGLLRVVFENNLPQEAGGG
ncbi:hypothetical protein [Rhizobium leguminosarum]|uniref:hypothetical protein n=1 Tax=Rhizobium leguminosarum TaxID=384 RepID=UPI001FE09D80|nr:hypothetical protein [Rhizobium leguminosarum]